MECKFDLKFYGITTMIAYGYSIFKVSIN